MVNVLKNFFLIFFAAGITGSGIAQDVSYDKKVGAENAKLVEQEMGIYHHDSLSRLVNAVGQKLVSRLKE